MEIQLIVNYNTTIKELLERYFLKIDHYYDDYYEKLKNKIDFYYNNKILNYDDETTVEKYFDINDSLKLIKQGKNIEKILLINDKNNLIKIISATFKDNHGYEEEIKVNAKKSINEILEKYLNVKNHSEIIYFKDIIQFLYNQKNLKLKDKTSVGDFFINDFYPIIQVIDVNNLLLKDPILKYNVTFKTTSGFDDKSGFYIYYNMEVLISNYLDFKEHPELKNKKNLINFLYNGKQIDEKESSCECFKNNFHPIILVIDPHNLLKKSYQNEQSQKMNIIFITTNRERLLLLVNYGTTIDRLLKLYLWKRGEYERGKKFIYFYNVDQLKFGDQRLIEKVFYPINPKIIVNDALA